MQVILASNSSYKQSQFNTLRIPYLAMDANINEQHPADAKPKALAMSLALEKANQLSRQFPEGIIIGSDQTASNPEGGILTKPNTNEKAVQQLLACSGKTVTFHSAVAIVAPNQQKIWSVDTRVTFRTLMLDEIQRYLEADSPLDCAGAFKVESLGISLFDRVESNDPSALIGLPLISLCQGLRDLGLRIP